MNRRSLALSLLVAFAGSACGGTPFFDYKKEFDPRRSEYVIGAADTLRVTVWRNADLSGELTVRPDGTITMPLLGDLQVAGRTPTEVKNEITKRLGAFVKDESAVVTVAVTAVHSYRFTVAGNVARPGTFDASHYVTVAEAIAMAGGPTRFADTAGVLLVRPKSDGTVRRIPINYDRIRSGERPEMDLALLAGDTVFVP